MPYASDKKKMPTELKKSAKLTQEDKDEIRYRYLNVGDVSQYKLAEEYGVSRRSIQFAIYPEKQKENYQKRVKKGGSRQYYNKEKNTEAVRNSRRRKHQLDKEGKLD